MFLAQIFYLANKAELSTLKYTKRTNFEQISFKVHSYKHPFNTVSVEMWGQWEINCLAQSTCSRKATLENNTQEIVWKRTLILVIPITVSVSLCRGPTYPDHFDLHCVTIYLIT